MTHKEFLDGTPMLSRQERIEYMRKVSECYVQERSKKPCPFSNRTCMDCVFATFNYESIKKKLQADGGQR